MRFLLSPHWQCLPSQGNGLQTKDATAVKKRAHPASREVRLTQTQCQTYLPSAISDPGVDASDMNLLSLSDAGEPSPSDALHSRTPSEHIDAGTCSLSSDPNSLDLLKMFDLNRTSLPSEFAESSISLPPHITTFRILDMPSINFLCLTENDRSQQFLNIYQCVKNTRLPNYAAARIPIPQTMNTHAWRQLFDDNTSHSRLLDYIEFGWPANYIASDPPLATNRNHYSAIAYEVQVQNYISTELKGGSLLGPFTSQSPPFIPWYQTNPLMTAPKNSTSTSRRVIMDLSWPTGHSVNDGIPSDQYDGTPCKLHLPRTDDLIELILEHGPSCYLYTRDIARAYRQIKVDPMDWPLLCFRKGDDIYVDTSIPFGLRWGAMCCTSITYAITRFLYKQHHDRWLVYIDDYCGCNRSYTAAMDSYTRLSELFKTLGIQEAVHKANPPCTHITWLGIEFHTDSLTILMPEVKILNILSILRNEWLHKTYASKRQLQQILGKLLYLSQTVKPARLFVSRMLETLRAATLQAKVKLSPDFKKDINWFVRFLPAYNGLHMMQPTITESPIEVDSCLTGCGGLWGDFYYHTQFPDFIMDMNLHISCKEMLNIALALKLFANKLRDAVIQIYSDSATAVAVLNSGRSHTQFLLACAREVWLVCAQQNIDLVVSHKPGRLIPDADALSREHLSTHFREYVEKLGTHRTRININPELFHLCDEL